ncbi:MAG: hypothetical protein K5648_05225 [Erysipelotrichaceae bacterium]|nr:hypothetical protein [Erysipelotrichaceae bacterium]
MKKKILLTLICLLAVSLFGCSSGNDKKEVQYTSTLFDNVKITYPEGSDYEGIPDGDTYYSFLSKEKGTEISFSREVLDAQTPDADDLLKGSVGSAVRETEDGILYGEVNGGLVRILDSSYYRYVIYRIPPKESVSEEALAEMDEIFFKIALDPQVVVQMPVLPDDTFRYLNMTVSTPGRQAFAETAGDFDFGVMSEDGKIMIYTNSIAKADTGYSEEAMRDLVYADKEVRKLDNGFEYYTADFTSEAGTEFTHYYSLMQDDGNFYDVYGLIYTRDKSLYEDTVIGILSKIRFE